MSNTRAFNLDQHTIDELGIRLSTNNPIVQVVPDARIFEYQDIKDVYIMESDLYGNPMPEGSVFLAFEGRAGLMGKHLNIATLKSSSHEDIKKIVADNHAG